MLYIVNVISNTCAFLVSGSILSMSNCHVDKDTLGIAACQSTVLVIQVCSCNTTFTQVYVVWPLRPLSKLKQKSIFVLAQLSE